MRKFLNVLYKSAGALAAACLVLIALMVIVQVFGRIFDGLLGLLGYPPYGFLVPSLAEIAGFLLVGASFLALASTLRLGDHIRVTILLQQVPKRIAHWLEAWCLLVAFAIVSYFAWQSGLQASDSYVYHEVSFGIIPIPLWIPQTVMTVGLAVFAVSILDDLCRIVFGGKASYHTAYRADAIEGVE